MRVYIDSSALIKRSVEEPESDAVERAIQNYAAEDTVLLTSTLAWVEVSRAIRRASSRAELTDDQTLEGIERALSGIAERLMTEDVVSLARRVSPPTLRTLDAIHLASALVLDVDRVIAYDDRLIDACRQNGLQVLSPGRATS